MKMHPALKVYHRAAILGLLALGVICAAYPATKRVLAAEDGAKTDDESLAEKLKKEVGSPIHIELKTGQIFSRAKLIRVNVDRKNTVVSISVQEPDGGKPRLLTLGVIRSIILNREKVYEAAIGAPKTAAEKRLKEQLEKAAKERAEWVARAKKNKVSPWPELSPEEHEKAIEALREIIDKLGKEVPNMQLHETQEFLFFTNIPSNQVGPYIKALDAMHDMMCKMYDIRQGEPVWKGKCLVVAFLNKNEFLFFEEKYLKNPDASGAYGICHSRSDGQVIIACYRGERPEDFAKMLVHETSHGFIHRYRTPVRVPSWVNEGMADCIARILVPASTGVQRREQEAIQHLRQTRTMGGDFLTRKGNIEFSQYGIASSLTAFLMKSDKAAYTRFIQGIKEGLSWQDSLKAAYSRTPEELVKAYGKAIGVPDLTP